MVSKSRRIYNTSAVETGEPSSSTINKYSATFESTSSVVDNDSSTAAQLEKEYEASNSQESTDDPKTPQSFEGVQEEYVPLLHDQHLWETSNRFITKGASSSEVSGCKIIEACTT